MRQLKLFFDEPEVHTIPETEPVPAIEVKDAGEPRIAWDDYFVGWSDIELLRNGTPGAMEVFLTRYRKTLEGFPEEFRGLVVAKWMSVGQRYRVVRSTKLVTWLIYVGNNAIRDAQRKLKRHDIGASSARRVEMPEDKPEVQDMTTREIYLSLKAVDPLVAKLALAVMEGQVEPDTLTAFERDQLQRAWEAIS